MTDWTQPDLPAGATPVDDILDVLDECASGFVGVPMLDNGYFYPAATRLSAFHAPGDWWLVVEVFESSPRDGIPDLALHTCSSNLRSPRTPESFVDREAYDRWVADRANRYSKLSSVAPVTGDWIDPEDSSLVALDARSVLLRDMPFGLPSPDEYAAHGITLSEPPRIRVHELCRYIAAVEHDQILSTPEERRVSVQPHATEILVVDEWYHPDIVNDELPSDTETFQQLATVLATGDPSAYHPTEPPNTHWRNWPKAGGALVL